MDRDFKGVWIPAEVWLNEDLTMLEKALLTEIDSLDGEDGCYATNQYLAQFCNCSESKVSKAITKLEKLGYIRVVSFNGRKRIIESVLGCIVKSTRQDSKKYEAASEKVRLSNIDNKTDKKGIFINKNTNCKKLVKKKSLYQKEMDEIQLFTKDVKIQKALTDFLNLQLEIYKEQGKVYYTNIFKNRLNKLREDFKEDEWLDVIKHATSKGWQNFYPIKETKPSKKKKTYDDGVSCEQYTEEEWEEIRKWQKEQEEMGEQITF